MEQSVLVFSVGKRKQTAVAVQNVLTEFARCIRTRVGFHNAEPDGGLIVLELMGKKEDYKKLADALGKVEGIRTQLVTL